MKFLHQETPMTKLLGWFMDLVLLNVFWVVCSIPIITAGASTTALYDVAMKMALGEEISVSKAFFSSFVRNLKRGTLLLLLALAAGVFLAADFFAATQWNVPFKIVLQIMILSAAYFYIAAVSHAFPALAYFQEPVMQTVKHGFLLAMRNGIYTVYVMLLDLIPVLMLFFYPLVFWKSIIFWVVIGVALLAWLNALHLVRLFDPERAKAAEERTN